MREDTYDAWARHRASESGVVDLASLVQILRDIEGSGVGTMYLIDELASRSCLCTTDTGRDVIFRTTLVLLIVRVLTTVSPD